MIARINPIFVSDASRCLVNVLDSNCYLDNLARVRSYGIRCNYEFEYCKLVGGKCYFLTFTFNNRAVVKIDGLNYCNNQSFRLLMINKVNKTLQRKYGCTCRYFCVGEMGEGKGKRGYGNNPHLHVVFFVYRDTSLPNSNIPDGNEFERICKDYWQGVGVNSARYYRYGIVSRSSQGIEVKHFKAFAYLTKYVLKDVVVQRREKRLLRSLFNIIYNLTLFSVWRRQLGIYDLTRFNDVVKDYDFKHFPLDSELNLIKFCSFCVSSFVLGQDGSDIKHLCNLIFRRIKHYFLPKILISNYLGLYGVDFVGDDGKIDFDTKHGTIRMPMPLYYFRKLYCDVRKYIDSKGNRNVRYVHNDRWINKFLSLDEFTKRFDNLYFSTRQLVSANSSRSIDSIYYFLNRFHDNCLTYLSTDTVPLSSITDDDVMHYCLYRIVYFGRSSSPASSYCLDPFVTAYNDFCYFCQSDYLAEQSPYPSVDLLPDTSYWASYIPIFNSIDYLLLYVRYYKNIKFVKSQSQIRSTLREFFSFPHS